MEHLQFKKGTQRQQNEPGILFYVKCMNYIIFYRDSVKSLYFPCVLEADSVFNFD